MRFCHVKRKAGTAFVPVKSEGDQPMIPAFFVALLGVISAQAAPGPNMAAVAGVAFSQGRRAALLVVAGISSGTIVWAAGTAFGLGELFRRMPETLTFLMFAGGGYLVFLAFRSLRSLWRRDDSDLDASAPGIDGWAAWRRGLLVVLTNPKAALMWSAIATFLFGAGLPQGAVFAFGPVVAASAACIYGTYAIMFSSRAAGGIYRRFRRAIEAIFAAAFGGLGAMLIVAGIRAIRP